MHPRNRYLNARPNFGELAAKYPDIFSSFVHADANGRATIDFSDEHATRALTQVLLLHDFGLYWDLPQGHLCPPVPNRLNYVHWVEDLLQLSAASSCARGYGVVAADCSATDQNNNGSQTFVDDKSSSGSDGNIRTWGLDIGTGASCIFPLLGSALHTDWGFVATDVDAASIQHARANVSRNRLQHRILCRHIAMHDSQRTMDVPLLPRVGKAGPAHFDFCICNPPFFCDDDDAARLETQIGSRSDRPSGGCAAATTSERVTHGGEVGFICRLLHESIAAHAQTKLKAHERAPGSVVRCRWYTTMLGRKRSLRVLLAQLRRCGVHNVRSTALVQGQTRRWALAWSFGDEGIEALRKQYGCLGPLAEAFNGASSMARHFPARTIMLSNDAACPTDSELGTSASARTLACKKDARRRNVCEFTVKLVHDHNDEDSSEPLFDFVRHRIDGVLQQQAGAPGVAIEVSEPHCMPAITEGVADTYLLEGRFSGEVSVTAAVVVRHRQLNNTGTVRTLQKFADRSQLQQELWFDFCIAWTRAVAQGQESTVELSFCSGGGCGVRAQFWRLCDVMRRDVTRLGRRWNRIRQKQHSGQKKKRKLHESASATEDN